MPQTLQYNITLIGTEGTGKTCFLAGLAVLGLDPIGKTPFLIFPPDEDTKNYLNSLRDTLLNGSWMPPTNISTFVVFDVFFKRTKTTLRLQMLDYSGEQFRKVYNELTPEEAQQSFSEHIEKSNVILLLLDANDLVSISHEEHRRSLSEKIRAQFTAVWKEMGKETDIGVLVTKSDTIPELKNAAAKRDHGARAAERFVKKYLGDFKETLRDIAKIEGFQGIGNIDNRKIKFYPVSAVGATDAETGRPTKDRLQPYGYNAIFQWVAERPDRVGCRWVLSIVLLGLVCVGVALGVAGLLYKGGEVITVNRDEAFLVMMESPNLSLFDKLEQANRYRPFTEFMQESHRKAVDEELDRQRERIARATDNRILDDIRSELARLEEQGVGGAENELRLLKDSVENKLVGYYYDRVKDAEETKSANFEAYANDFLDRYPNVLQAADVRTMLDQWNMDTMRTAKSLIHEIAVNTPSQLRSKMERMGSFLRDFENRLTPNEQEEMRQAMELARKFLESTDYTITLRQYGGFSYAEDINLNIRIGNNAFTYESNGKVRTANPGKTFNVRWRSGERIELEIQAYAGRLYGGVEKVASVVSSDADALTLLNGRRRLLPASSGWNWNDPKYMAPGGYFVDCTIQRISPEQWRAYEKYIKPGNGWRE